MYFQALYSLHMQNTEDGRSSRWDSHRQTRRVELIESAIEAIEAEGPDVRIEQIAERAGLARPLLYRHFEDRSGLQSAIISYATNSLLETLSPQLRPEAVAPGQLIKPALATYFAWVGAHPNLSRYCLRHSDAASVESLRTVIAQQLSAIFSVFFGEFGMTSVAASFLATGIAGLTEANAMWWLEDNDKMTLDLLAEQTGRQIFAILQNRLAELNVDLQDDGTVRPRTR